MLYKVHESLEQLEIEEYYRIELNDFAIFRSLRQKRWTTGVLKLLF